MTLEKLHAIGLSKHSVKGYQSYLINRTFLLNLGSAFSQPAYVSSGVPQGSILGPLVFLISMRCHKLSNVTFTFTLMMHALPVNIKILMKLKNN